VIQHAVALSILVRWIFVTEEVVALIISKMSRIFVRVKEIQV
jgi:hypothetical protein